MQGDVIKSAVSGQDTLAILPTGGGKSLCFQIPTIATGRPALVVSPLIALMHDQVETLVGRGIGATSITSELSVAEADRRITGFREGQYVFLYASPERLSSPVFRAKMKTCDIGILAVDEAHCISEWGMVFRPSYRLIAEFRNHICPSATLIAVTATATPRVQRDIQKNLKMRDASIHRSTIDRPNIKWSVRPSNSKRNQVREALVSAHGCKIVYSNTRKSVDRCCDWLRREGFETQRYHGGMTSTDRSAALSSWMDSDSSTMVATNAFGMGIDKPDVRIVVHIALPRTIESYYQEAGRAGRDGEACEALLLYNLADVSRLERYVTFACLAHRPVARSVKLVQKHLRNLNLETGWVNMNVSEHIKHTGLAEFDVRNIVDLMKRKRLIDVIAGEDTWTIRAIDKKGLSKLPGHLRRFRRRTVGQIRSMKAYLDLAVCRRRYLLNYFGEPTGYHCGYCSTCLEEETRHRSSVTTSEMVNFSI